MKPTREQIRLTVITICVFIIGAADREIQRRLSIRDAENSMIRIQMDQVKTFTPGWPQ